MAGEFPLPVWPWVWMPVLAVTGQPPVYAEGVKVGVCIAMDVCWGCQGGCVHSYGCTLGVSRWVCA